MIHTALVAGEHVTEGFDCWCRPRVFRPCPECDGEDGCWRCEPIEASDGSGQVFGMIPVDDPESPEWDGVGLMIVHNDMPRPAA